jgi:hypothetical protein
MSKVDRSAELEGILEKVLKNRGDLQKLVEELGVGDEAAAEAEGTTAVEPPADDNTKS